jgi:hypothetical protein
MKKLAYIYFGQVKNYNRIQHDQFSTNVLPGLKNFDVDFFLTTTPAEKYVSPRQGEDGVINYKSINNFINFKKIYYDDILSKQKEFEDFANSLLKKFRFRAWRNFSLPSTINSLKQIYSLNYFYDQFKDIATEYEYFIVARSDLFFLTKLSLPQLNSHNIYLPDWGHYKDGCNDRYAVITSLDILKIYCCRYNFLRNNPEPYHAESYLRKCLKRNGVKFKQFKKFKFRLLRSCNHVSTEGGGCPDKALTKKFYNINL